MSNSRLAQEVANRASITEPGAVATGHDDRKATTGIMLLVQQGKVGLDDKISKYLEGTPESWSTITVRHLLTHTSGIVREAPGFDPCKIQSDVDVIKTAYPLPLRFQPGEKWEYCNVGYLIEAGNARVCRSAITSSPE